MRLEPLSSRESGPAGVTSVFTLSQKDPVFRGLQTHLENYQADYWRFSKAGTRPAKTPVQPSFGDPDTGRSGTPLLYTGTHTAHSDESQNAFGNPGTGRPGIPFFTPGLIPLTATSPDAFGDLDTGRSRLPFFTPGLTPLTATSAKTLLGTLIQAGQDFPSLHRDSYRSQRRVPTLSGTLRQAGQDSPSLHPDSYRSRRRVRQQFRKLRYRQAGDSLFYSSRRLIANLQRPSTFAPAHSPCNGRAASNVSNNPLSLRRTRQLASLPATCKWPFCALPSASNSNATVPSTCSPCTLGSALNQTTTPSGTTSTRCKTRGSGAVRRPIIMPTIRPTIASDPNTRGNSFDRGSSSGVECCPSSSSEPCMFHVILFQPEIPPNTGNIIRLCANSGCHLHLIEPIGFEMDDKRLRRAGLDYHEYATLKTHADLASCLESLGHPRLFAFTTKGSRLFHDARFAEGDAFLFGPESRGLPAEVLDALPGEQRLRLPMREGCRSLNLSNTVAVAVYEGWRQLGFA